LVSGSREAYRYLAASVREFVAEDEVRSLLAGAGLTQVDSRRLTGGVAGLYRGVKS
jgi:ubiquinone/menaquinone biosynthesis C-methylase UbiE